MRIENDTIIVLFAHIMDRVCEREKDRATGQKFVKTIKSKYKSFSARILMILASDSIAVVDLQINAHNFGLLRY